MSIFVHGTRYQMTDVARTAGFNTNHLGLKPERQVPPAFAV